MNDLSCAVEKIYSKKNELIIIGLTGKTGSGCTKTASILKKEKVDDLDLREAHTQGKTGAECRKYSICKKFMEYDKHWTGFSVIEASSIIFLFVLESTIQGLIDYLGEITHSESNNIIQIGDLNKVTDIIKSLDYMYTEATKFSINNLNKSSSNYSNDLNNYYLFYTKTISEYRDRFKELLSQFSCNIINKTKLQGATTTQYHLYTFLMQRFGNNVRASGNPFIDKFDSGKYDEFINRINEIIRLIHAYKCDRNEASTRICIDAIRNPFEAYFLKDRYKSFYLISIHTEENSRLQRLNMTKEQIKNIDRIEFVEKSSIPQELFYHQNIPKCLEIADIHLFNPQVNNNKYYELTKQILKYVSLILKPGIITPTHVERCMQIAFNAKYNSGCLSRQVGATVTDENFSVKAVGWNDVPQGQVPCNLRDIKSYCINKDSESFSKFEIEDLNFDKAMKKINIKISKEMLKGKTLSYCFKDIYNGIKGTSNQVFTRSLHAEENAFLQISKYGGQGIIKGKLFTTASPCELCAKKAYQLGIREIYYIDPYPGISKDHILSFGEDSNPDMIHFTGAIGEAYLSLYTPRLPYKDELELYTEASCKDIAKKFNEDDYGTLGIKDIRYTNICTQMTFESRSKIKCVRNYSFRTLTNNITRIDKKLHWTGSSFDNIKLDSSSSDCQFNYCQNADSSYRYSLIFNNPLMQNQENNYVVTTEAKDEKEIMQPYLAQLINNFTDKLQLVIIVPKELISDVKGIVYADLKMENKYEEIQLQQNEDKNNEIYILNIEKPNLFYTYSVEWKFK